MTTAWSCCEEAGHRHQETDPKMSEQQGCNVRARGKAAARRRRRASREGSTYRKGVEQERGATRGSGCSCGHAHATRKPARTVCRPQLPACRSKSMRREGPSATHVLEQVSFT
jgi:hypothetical protein